MGHLLLLLNRMAFAGDEPAGTGMKRVCLNHSGPKGRWGEPRQPGADV